MSTPVKTLESFVTRFAHCQSKTGVLQAIKEKAAEAFLQIGLPLRHEESWKYTDVSYLHKHAFKRPNHTAMVHIKNYLLPQTESILFVFINGQFNQELSLLSLLPQTVRFCSLTEAWQDEKIQDKIRKEVNPRRYPFANLNLALMNDGLFLAIPKTCHLKQPLHFLYINTHDKDFISCPRQIVLAEEGSHFTIVEEHVGLQTENNFTNIRTDLYIQQQASVQYYKIQREHNTATHIAQTFVYQNQDSQLQAFSLALGSKLGREDITVDLAERGAATSINGFYAVKQPNQHIDNHIHINHHATHGTSQMMYKGIIAQNAKAVFNGKVFVAEAAQKTQSLQANHNLLLADSADVSTKPELEIYADDVKCAHGATVGQLNAESMFYLRSRGVAEAEALQMLTAAFATEVLEHVKHAGIADHMQDLLSEALAYEA